MKNSLQSRIWIGFAGYFFSLLFAINALTLSAFAQSVLAVPELTARVIDQTATLSSEQIASLSSQLKKLEDERGAQVVILMVASTLPEDVFSYSNRVSNAWKVGRKGVGDGVLILVAKDDRKLRIEIAKSLEGAIPDVLAGQIVKESIAPQFKQGQYASGLQAGIEQISARIAGEALPAPQQTRNTAPDNSFVFDPLALILFAFFAIPVIGSVARQILGNKLGVLAVAAGAGTLGWFITTSLAIAGIAGIAAAVITLISSLKTRGLMPQSSGGWNGAGRSGGDWGGGFGSSGGGFSSGGGGDFGGGGASGDW